MIIDDRPRCRGCDGTLDPTDTRGLHPVCTAPLAPMLPDLVRILGNHQANQPRSRQQVIGPSEVGVACDRALAYRLYVPRPEGDLKWAPWLGTMAHGGIAEAFEAENVRLGRERYLIERRVEIEPGLLPGGSTDLYDTDTDEVVDWKLVGRSTMDTYRRKGPGSVYRTQGHLYGMGWERAGFPIRSIRIVFLPRWSHQLRDGYEWQEGYQRELAQGALDRLERILHLGKLAAESVLPWAAIGADTTDCRYCKWLDRSLPAPTIDGCPGERAVVTRAAARFERGLIADAA